MGIEYLELHSPVPICDFCSVPQVRFRHKAVTAIVGAPLISGDRMVIRQSVGDWAACVDCNELVRLGHRDQLAERSLRYYLATRTITTMSAAQLLAGIKEVHDVFWQSRTGEIVEVTA